MSSIHDTTASFIPSNADQSIYTHRSIPPHMEMMCDRSYRPLHCNQIQSVCILGRGAIVDCTPHLSPSIHHKSSNKWNMEKSQENPPGWTGEVGGEPQRWSFPNSRPQCGPPSVTLTGSVTYTERSRPIGEEMNAQRRRMDSVFYREGRLVEISSVIRLLTTSRPW